MTALNTELWELTVVLVFCPACNSCAVSKTYRTFSVGQCCHIVHVRFSAIKSWLVIELWSWIPGKFEVFQCHASAGKDYWSARKENCFSNIFQWQGRLSQWRTPKVHKEVTWVNFLAEVLVTLVLWYLKPSFQAFRSGNFSFIPMGSVTAQQ